jgi:hypothetical protein
MRAIFRAGGTFCSCRSDAIGAAATGCPFAHDTHGTMEAFSLQAAPKFGSIVAARVPGEIAAFRVKVAPATVKIAPGLFMMCSCGSLPA